MRSVLSVLSYYRINTQHIRSIQCINTITIRCTKKRQRERDEADTSHRTRRYDIPINVNVNINVDVDIDIQYQQQYYRHYCHYPGCFGRGGLSDTGCLNSAIMDRSADKKLELFSQCRICIIVSFDLEKPEADQVSRIVESCSPF